MNRDELTQQMPHAALAFRGYNITNLGRSRELLEHNLYGPLAGHVDFQSRMFPNAGNFARYDDEIARKGGFVFGVIGIGPNAHIGFCEPGSDPDGLTSKVTLTEESRRHNDGLFGGDWKNVPETAYSVGLKTVRQIPQLVMFAFGQAKVEPVFNAFCRDASPAVPASSLAEHGGLNLVIDDELFHGLVARASIDPRQ